MKQLPPFLFIFGYFLGGWAAIWTLVVILSRSDPKFSEAVGFYYGLWICFYLPIAIMGAIALSKMSGGFSKRVAASLICLAAVLAAMFFSFYFDVPLPILIPEYLAFAGGFWLIAKTKNNTGQDVGGNPLPRLESKVEP